MGDKPPQSDLDSLTSDLWVSELMDYLPEEAAQICNFMSNSGARDSASQSGLPLLKADGDSLSTEDLENFSTNESFGNNFSPTTNVDCQSTSGNREEKIALNEDLAAKSRSLPSVDKSLKASGEGVPSIDQSAKNQADSHATEQEETASAGNTSPRTTSADRVKLARQLDYGNPAATKEPEPSPPNRPPVSGSTGQEETASAGDTSPRTTSADRVKLARQLDYGNRAATKGPELSQPNRPLVPGLTEKGGTASVGNTSPRTMSADSVKLARQLDYGNPAATKEPEPSPPNRPSVSGLTGQEETASVGNISSRNAILSHDSSKTQELATNSITNVDKPIPNIDKVDIAKATTAGQSQPQETISQKSSIDGKASGAEIAHVADNRNQATNRESSITENKPTSTTVGKEGALSNNQSNTPSAVIAQAETNSSKNQSYADTKIPTGTEVATASADKALAKGGTGAPSTINSSTLFSPPSSPTSPPGKVQMADAVSPASSTNSAINNQPSLSQLLDAAHNNIGLSRDSNSALTAGSVPLPGSQFSYPLISSNMQTLDINGKPVADNTGTLSVKESGAVYSAFTAAGFAANARLANDALANGTLANGALANNALANGNIANAAGPGALVIKDAQTIKDAQVAANATGSQAIAQALQGILQQGQGAASKLDETSKTIKGTAGPVLPEALAINQGGKKGSGAQAEGIITGVQSATPLSVKAGRGAEISEEIKLTGAQTGNVNTSGIIITATAGATVNGQITGVTPGAAGSAVTGTGSAGSGTGGATGTTATGAQTIGTTTTNTTTPGATDPNATDIKSLINAALPSVEIYDSKHNTQEDEESHSTRREIDNDTTDDDDLDEEDNYIDQPVVETRRTNSSTYSPVKGSKIGLSIIENIMVLLQDLKSKQVDDATSKQMLLDLYADIFGKQKRLPYAVRAEDTLEHIARYVLKDARLAPLLYTINVHAKNIKPIANEKSEAAIGAIKPDVSSILLPHRAEILRYKIHVLKDQQALIFYAKNRSATTGDFTTYTCREGDTLKSIAAYHMDIQHESNWAEIALLNGLSVLSNRQGEPIAKLKEGQTLKIPKNILQEEYVDEWLPEPPIKNMPLTGAIANLSIDADDDETLANALSKMEKRIISQSDLGNGNDSLLLKLELKTGDTRLNVAEWSVNEMASTLKLFDKYGSCKIIPIALPTRAVRELAENDLKANADRYCKMFLTGQLAA